MRQYNECCSSIIVGGEEFRERVVGEMPDSGHYALLHRPGIRSAAKHLQIVIGRDKQVVTSAKIHLHVGRHIAEIGSQANLHAFGAKHKANGIGRIVWDGEWK